MEFWDFYNNTAAPRLLRREMSFRKVFEYLDTLRYPVNIVETGCARIPNNWEGDGQSTILFDKYLNSRDRISRCFSVDVSPDSVSQCRQMVSERVNLFTDDSVHFLKKLGDKFFNEGLTIDLLYLDSYDLDWIYWQPSAIHHLKEFCAISKVLRKDSIVLIDDCCLTGDFVVENKKLIKVNQLQTGGKGRLVAEYARATGAKILFSDYQLAITGF
jgi:hypothetical protein